MNITADAVKQLRERTGAGMMACQQALEEAKGDRGPAAELMRKQGHAKADKKAARLATEGVVAVAKSADAHTAAMVEINCETDFVAREQGFRAFAQAVADCALTSRPASLSALGQARLPSGESIEERRRALVAKIGENISVRRFAVLSSPGYLGAYVHGTRIGALVAVRGGAASLAYDLAMHVAASNPRYLTQAQGPAEVRAKEREILTQQAQGEGKPPEIVARMVEGRLRKALGEITLAGQPFVKDLDGTIEMLLEGAKAEMEMLLKGAKGGVVAFERFEVGAGIEKRQDGAGPAVRH